MSGSIICRRGMPPSMRFPRLGTFCELSPACCLRGYATCHLKSKLGACGKFCGRPGPSDWPGSRVRNMNQNRNWFCAQMGGREHYAIPRALFAAGALGGLMTDYWAGSGTRALARFMSSKPTRSLGAKCHAGLPAETVESWNLRALAWEARLRRMTSEGGVAGRYLGYCEVGKSFARAVIRSLKARRGLPENSVFFGYDTASLEIMEHLKARGVSCIVD